MRRLRNSCVCVGFIVGAMMFGAGGCAPAQPTGDSEKTVPAQGVLTYQGEPLEFHRVTLYPDGQRPAAGTTDEQGQFVLGTNKEGDGAVAGLHRVAVVYVGAPGSGGDGITDFSPPPPPRVEIPEKYASPDTSELTVEIPTSGDRELKIDLE